ncbi:MAG TPA: peptidoglycan-binding protein [Candidatus Paceibacterota bacterium]
MRKSSVLFVALLFVASTSFPVLASGQGLTDENLKKIQELTNQIKALQEQIRALQAQQIQLQASSTHAIAEIVQSLRQGSAGDQVKVLQTLLSLNAAIYPEGAVTGFFGPATRRALERFQRANGLEVVGFAGPRTRALLNSLIRKEFKEASKIDDDVAEDVKEAIASITLPTPPAGCAIPGLPTATSSPFIVRDGKVKIVQTGNIFIYHDGKHKIVITPNTYIEKDGKKQLLITPGMRIEKDGKFKMLVPCNATTTPPLPDTTPPSLSSLTATSVTHQSASVSWITNEQATGQVYFGTTTPFSLSSTATQSNSSLLTNHSFNLTGLSATTTYNFVVVSKDAAGNTATSSQQSFTTAATPDTTAPIISALGTVPASTTAQVTWTTDEVATGKVYYATTTPVIIASALFLSDTSLMTSHSFPLVGLTASTTHYLFVESKDAVGNTATSSQQSFVTTN